MLRVKTRAGGSVGALAALVLTLAALSAPAASATVFDSESASQSDDTQQSGQSGEEGAATVAPPAPEIAAHGARMACPFSGATITPPPLDSDELLGGGTVEGGRTIGSSAPIPHFTEMQGGTGTMFAQTDSGEVWTWGDETLTLTGTSQPAVIYRPTEMGGEPIAFHQIAVQSRSVLALDQNCRLWAWGDNHQGQLGLGETSGYEGSRAFVPSPVMVTDSDGNPYFFQKVATSPSFSSNPVYSIGLDLDGHVKVWGGVGSSSWNSDVPWTQDASSDVTFTDIALSFDPGLTGSDGMKGIWAYGIVSSPFPFRDGMPAYWNIEADGGMNYIRTDHFGLSWQSSSPDRCATNDDFGFTQISTEYQGGAPDGNSVPRMLALSNCGTLWELGQINLVGGGSFASAQIGSKAVYDDVYITELATNLNSVVMLSSNTSISPVWTFGNNQWGQLGIGKTPDELKESDDLVPVTDLAGKDIIDIATGGEFVLALASNGAMWGWGDNEYGQLSLPDPILYTSPQPIAIRPAVSLYVEDESGTRTSLPQDGIVWELDDDGLSTGEFTATMPSHKSGYYPVYQVVGSTFSGTPGGGIVNPDLPAQKIGEYGFLFPLISLDHDTEYQVGVGGDVTTTGGLASAQASLGANATLNQQAETGLILDAGTTPWNGLTAVDGVDADAPGTYSLSVWAEVDGRVVSYNPNATRALDDTNLDECIAEPLVDGEINPLCAVQADLDFIGDTPLYIQKQGENDLGVVAPMNGSEWAIFADDNGQPGANLFPTGVPGATDDDEPTGTPLVGTFSATLEPGTYWLRETQALEGFHLLAEDIQFTVAADGTVELVSGAGGLASLGDGTFGDGRAMIIVQDVPKYALPAAMGANLGIFALVGIAIAAIGVAAARLTRGSKGRHSG